MSISIILGMGRKCYICNGDHWILQCPIKDMNDQKIRISDLNLGKKAEKTVDKTKTDAAATVRITNLSEDTNEIDVENLTKPFGPIRKVFLAKDKATGLCKGFAFVHFKNHSDAATAILALSGYTLDNLILNACWAKNKGQ